MVVTAFVTWPLPVVPLGTAQKFLIYFGLERLLQNARVEEVNEVPVSQLSCIQWCCIVMINGLNSGSVFFFFVAIFTSHTVIHKCHI